MKQNVTSKGMIRFQLLCLVYQKVPSKRHVLAVCTFRSQMEEFDFLYNEYEIKKFLNPGQIPEDLIKNCFLFILGREQHTTNLLLP